MCALVLFITPASIADPPVLNMPSDFTVAAVNASGATVNYTVTVTDPDDLDVALTGCSPSSGTVFPLGDTTVSCSARHWADDVRNSDSRSPSRMRRIRS